ncbi:hypothetical protein RHGRI_029521 [Rhododendron griersonianum]|uniref:valine--tRNA ligase n=1 Tax=Rhododendron griersonianum TaxID=479676 RepID=A0AAV6ILZ5_9ERIC|nr:hypothetical protein RHGRI_029521 [Rhododendron griersonianum]
MQVGVTMELGPVRERMSQRGTLQRCQMRLGICSRTNDVVEPLIKSQWYVRCNSMAKQALDAVFDEENKKMEIILRQYAAEWKRGDELKELGAYNDHWVVDRTEEEARTEASGIFSCKEMKEFQLAQDPDVLDTWFSSGLFPLTVLGWPDDTDDLKAFYPTSVLETGHDILFFWVARMVMLGFKLGGDVPFRKVYLHPVICDAHGRKMSKSLGNVIDPLEVINGITPEGLQKRLEEAIWIQQNWKLQKTDKERTSLMVFLNAVLMICILPLSLTQLRVVGYRQWCNKLWNVVRFALSKLGDDYTPPTNIVPDVMLQAQFIHGGDSSCVMNCGSAFLHLGIVICTRKDSIMLCEYPSVVESRDRVRMGRILISHFMKCELPFALCRTDAVKEIVMSHELEISTLATLSSLKIKVTFQFVLFVLLSSSEPKNGSSIFFLKVLRENDVAQCAVSVVNKNLSIYS